MATWNRVAKVRNDFADMIESLSDEQLNEQSLCDAWTAEGVLAHVTAFPETGLPSFFATIVKSGFNFDKASTAMANKQLSRPVEDVVASLRAGAAKSAAMPMFPEEMTLADVVIHTQDVRRGLGLDDTPDEEDLRTALDFMATDKLATMMVERPTLDGVRLVATDMDWSHGEGAEIQGTAEALLMALANRPVLDEVSGDGLSNWK